MVSPDIFFVEDDIDFTYIMKQVVEQIDKKISIQIISNGKEALDVLTIMVEKKIKPKLILLDFNLPGLSGVELLKKIRAMPYLQIVPILIFSTANNPKVIKNSLDAGANEYIYKLAGYSNLLNCVQEIINDWLGSK